MGMILHVAFFSLSICACGSSDAYPNIGLYKGAIAEMSNITLSLDDVIEGEVLIELKDAGKAVFFYEGKSHKKKWSLNRTSFFATGRGAELKGSLIDGNILLEDVLGSGISIVFERS